MNVLERATVINNEYRTASMNRRYYSYRLESTQALNRSLEIIVAVSSSATAAAWRIWQTGAGDLAWKLFAGTAAIVAVVKPLLRLGKDIERYSELSVGYATVYYDLKVLVEDLIVAGDISGEAWSRYCAIRQRTRDLGIKDDLSPRRRLHRRCFEQVKAEIPSRSLWWPREEEHGSPATTAGTA